jgi:mRNA-degrading endonuclease RelE of RelBE toxin-antitoxin system
MNILFQETKKFEKDLRSFQEKDRKRIIGKINLYCGSGEMNFRDNSFRPLKVILENNEVSSLYSVRITPEIRVILTYEDDPLFDQTVITLLRVVRRDSLEKAFKGIAESIYQGNVKFGSGDNNG